MCRGGDEINYVERVDEESLARFWGLRRIQIEYNGRLFWSVKLSEIMYNLNVPNFRRTISRSIYVLLYSSVFREYSINCFVIKC